MNGACVGIGEIFIIIDLMASLPKSILPQGGPIPGMWGLKGLIFGIGFVLVAGEFWLSRPKSD